MTNIKLITDFALTAASFWVIQKDTLTDARSRRIRQLVPTARYIVINQQ